MFALGRFWEICLSLPGERVACLPFDPTETVVYVPIPISDGGDSILDFSLSCSDANVAEGPRCDQVYSMINLNKNE